MEGKLSFNIHRSIISKKVFFKKFFYFGLFFISLQLFAQKTYAATVSWDGGGGDGKWETANNWSANTLPDSTDVVTIDNATVTLSSGQTASFSTLAVGLGTNATELILAGDISTGGSISIDNAGILTQQNSVSQTITSTLTVKNGGILRHGQNSTDQLYVLNFNATNIDVQAGGSINVDGLGYGGSAVDQVGRGPGGGTISQSGYGGGAGHGGNGGDATGGTGGGGTGNCSITDINTIGSGGSTIADGAGSYGGGLIILNTTSTLTINGTISARGSGGSGRSGGGSGGGVKLTANTIAGSPEAFTVNGQNSLLANGGGGGGGCVQVSFTSSNTITSSTVNLLGGTGYQHGGAGQLFIKQTSATYGDLYVVGSNVLAATTTQAVSSLTLNSLSLSKSNYFVPSGKTLALSHSSSVPFQGSTFTSKLVSAGAITLNTNSVSNGVDLRILSGGTFTNSSTLSIDSNSGLRLESGSTVSNTLTTVSSTGVLYFIQGASFSITNLIINSGTTTLANYSTSTSPLSLSTLTMNGGLLTHEQNTTAQTHIINISSVTTTIQAGASINVDGLGYGGSPISEAGRGPGGGAYNNSGYGSGGGHGGNGGSAVGYSTPGLAYCNTSNVNTVGSGGSGGVNVLGSYGGGLIILNTTSTLTINGTISAAGGAGAVNSAGGGAGGGVKLSANRIAGSPVNFLVNGGDAGSLTNAGGGGGGCVQITYSISNSITTSTISGGAGNEAGSAGSFNVTQLITDALPTTTAYSPVQISSTTVSFTTTVSDSDLDVTSLFVEYSLNGSTWSTSTLGSITVSQGSITTSTGYIDGIDTNLGSVIVTSTWNIFADVPNTDDTTVYLRITPNDGILNGSVNTSSAFAIDTKKPTQQGNLSISSASSTSIILGFPNTTSTDTNFLQYIIYYSSSSPVTENSSVFTSSSDSNLGNSNFNAAATTTITSLQPNTTYYFKIYSYDSWGYSTSSISETSTTTRANTPSAPTVFDATVSTLTITINSNSNSTSTEFAIYNSTDGNFLASNGSSNGSTPIWQTTSTWTAVVATGLTPNTAYQFSTLARNSAGVVTATSSLSSALSTLAAPQAPTAPTSTSNVSTSSIRYNWTSGGGGETYYILDYSTNGTSFTFVATSTPTSTTNYTFAGLNLNTRYWFRVAAGNGVSATSSYVTSSPVYTLATTPAAPTTVSSSATSTFSVLVDSTTIANNPTSTTLFIVKDTASSTEYYLQPDGSWSVSTTTLTYDQLGPGSATTTFGLTVNSLHTISVAAINGDGVTTTFGSSASVYTLTSAPTSSTATTDSASQITITWSGSGTNYYVENSTAGTNSGWISGATHSFTSLTCNTAYSFRVKARNGDAVETGYDSTVSATTSACPSSGGGGSGGGGGGGGGSSFYVGGVGSVYNQVANTSTFNATSIIFSSSLQNDFVFSSSLPSAQSDADSLVAINASSSIIFLKLPSSSFVKSGNLLSYVYRYRNATKTTSRVYVSRTIVNERNAIVASSGGDRVLKPGQSFSFEVKDKIDTKLVPGRYLVLITISDKGKKMTTSNGFYIQIIPNIPLKIVEKNTNSSSGLKFLKLPNESIKLGGVLQYVYQYEHRFVKTEKVRVVRQLISSTTGKVISSTGGWRLLKNNQTFNFSVNEKIAKNLVAGMYKVRIVVSNSTGAELVRLEQSIELKR